MTGETWAMGCSKCSYGLVRAPPPTGDVVYLVRLRQYQMGELEFCDCRAGLMYMAGLEAIREWLLREAQEVAVVTRNETIETRREKEPYQRRWYDD